MGLTFVVKVIIANNYIVSNKLIAEIWEQGHIAKRKADKVRNTTNTGFNQTSRQQKQTVKKLTLTEHSTQFID